MPISAILIGWGEVNLLCCVRLRAAEHALSEVS